MPAVRVLFVEDDEDDFKITQDLLSEVEDNEFELDWVRTYEEAIAAIGRGGYGAFLVDYRLGRRSGLDLLCGALKGGTIAPVIILTGEDVAQVDVEARKHGATGYLFKRDLTAEKLTTALRAGIAGRASISGTEQAAGPSAAWPTALAGLGRLFAVLGSKGGAGTSTIVSNIAAALVRRHLTITVLEMRGDHGNLTRLFDLVAYNDISRLLRVKPEEIDDARFEAALSLHPNGVRVLAGPQSAADYGDIGATHAQAIVDAAMRTSDAVVVDLPCSASAANRQVLCSADAVAMVIERDPSAIASARAVLSMLHAWQVPAPIGSVFVSRGSVPESMSVADINAQLGLKKYGAIPAAGDLFYKSAVTLIPVVTAHPAHPAGRALGEIATVLMKEPQNQWRANSPRPGAATNGETPARAAEPAPKPPAERSTMEWPSEFPTT